MHFQLIIPLMAIIHTNQATFYSCKQAELVICQSPSLNSCTHMIINKRKNLSLDINMTGNICAYLTSRHIHIIIFAMEKQKVLLLCLSVCVCILALVIWHARYYIVIICVLSVSTILFTLSHKQHNSPTPPKNH